MLSNIDVLSELAIAEILQNDLQDIVFANAAEKLQMEEVMTASAYAVNNGRPKLSDQEDPFDRDLALQIFATDARLTSDTAYAESLQLGQEASFIASRQEAQKLAASEKKIMLDAAFARKLQEVMDSNEMEVDGKHDVDSLLGRDGVEKILASDPNDTGKGKEPARFCNFDSESPPISEFGSSDMDMSMDMDASLANYPTCGICKDIFQETNAPICALLSANSSTRLPFGLRLPCPSKHAYCVSCMSSYIHSKLDPEDNGGGTDIIVFPIVCPECPIDEWTDGIPDDVAMKILGEKGMLLWHHQKLLDTIPRHYCPNPRCSALVQIQEDVTEQPQAICPCCEFVMCVPCKTQWHDDMSCEEFQAIPLDERSPDDLLMIQLAKAKKWRRCKSCSRVIELELGCNHMTCRCGNHFCFKCGAPWDTLNYRCTSTPSCVLWEDDMLLEDGARGDRAVPRTPPPPVPAVPPPIPLLAPPPYYAPYCNVPEAFDWIHDAGVVAHGHLFTHNMIRDTICGYCGCKCMSLADLRYHLMHVRRHPVFSCCGKFFRRGDDYRRHQTARNGQTHHLSVARE